ncbi:MAG: hypothetical protein CMB80_00175 [Flammeovirgaceae bacterium]|nr:hypothetical protein [Flammeovirgaceae bacterium]
MAHNRNYKSTKQISHIEHCLNKAVWEVRSDFITKEDHAEIIHLIEKAKAMMKMSSKEYREWFAKLQL